MVVGQWFCLRQRLNTQRHHFARVAGEEHWAAMVQVPFTLPIFSVSGAIRHFILLKSETGPGSHNPDPGDQATQAFATA
jgi:hypothetical protein